MFDRRGVAAMGAAAALAGLGLALSACGADEVGSVPGSSAVRIASPADGAEVGNPVRVVMEATGITIEPAGKVKPRSGHFHLMVDADCLRAGEVIPVDTPGYQHYGKAQTEAELDLEPGEHTLCLQVGDGAHVAQAPTDKISITVRD